MGEIIRWKIKDWGKKYVGLMLYLLTSLTNFLLIYSWGWGRISVHAGYLESVADAVVEEGV